jgi:hypothetical protein
LIFPVTTSPRQAAVRLPNGGVLILSEKYTDYFEAAAGSASKMTYDSVTDEYTLIAQDESRYVFYHTAAFGSGVYRLKTRIWPTGEAWTYTYTGNDLTEVAADATRKLTFTYTDQFGLRVLQRK